MYIYMCACWCAKNMCVYYVKKHQSQLMQDLSLGSKY